MARKYSTRLNDYVDLTPEEEAQLVVDAERSATRRAARLADEARREEIKVNEFVTQIEDAMRGKTFAEISAFIDGMTPNQRDRAFKALLLKWALEVK